MKIFLSPINFRIFGVSSVNLKIFMTKEGNEYFALRYVHQAMLSQNKKLAFKHLF